MTRPSKGQVRCLAFTLTLGYLSMNNFGTCEGEEYLAILECDTLGYLSVKNTFGYLSVKNTLGYLSVKNTLGYLSVKIEYLGILECEEIP